MPSTWPLWLRRLLDETTTHFARCYELARQRAAGNASSFKRLMAERDPIKPAISVTKEDFEDDPLLPVFRIEVVGQARRPACDC